MIETDQAYKDAIAARERSINVYMSVGFGIDNTAADDITDGTYEALQGFVGAFSRENGGEVYTVVLGCDGDEERFADTLTLANWYYNHVVAYPVTTSTVTAMNGAPLVARVPHADWTDKDVDVTVADPEATVPVFSLAGAVEQDIQVDTVSGNVTEGQKLGTLTLSQDGREIASVELVSAENQNAPDPVSWVLVQIDRLVRLVTGDPADTGTEIVSEPVAVTELDAA